MMQTPANIHSAFRWLGWAAGEISLAVACIVSYYTSYQLASLHHYEGARHNRYRDLGRAIFGTIRPTPCFCCFESWQHASCGAIRSAAGHVAGASVSDWRDGGTGHYLHGHCWAEPQGGAGIMDMRAHLHTDNTRHDAMRSTGAVARCVFLRAVPVRPGPHWMDFHLWRPAAAAESAPQLPRPVVGVDARRSHQLHLHQHCRLCLGCIHRCESVTD